MTITIDLSQTGLNAAAPAAAGYMNTAGFDITQSATFIVDETFHNETGTVPIPPPGATANMYWNAWQTVQVTQGGGTEVIKWSQPPEPFDPDNVYYGLERVLRVVARADGRRRLVLRHV